MTRHRSVSIALIGQFVMTTAETHWKVSAERILTHRTCLLSHSLLSHTPLWPNAGKLLGWCYIFNESRVFDLPVFIFFDVNWHSREQPALNVVQHEDRLIHYPLTGEPCGWGVHRGGLIICNSLEWDLSIPAPDTHSSALSWETLMNVGVHVGKWLLHVVRCSIFYLKFPSLHLL